MWTAGRPLQGFADSFFAGSDRRHLQRGQANVPDLADVEIVDAAENEIAPVKRAALYIKCNDLMWQETVFIPVMHRIKVGASANTLRPVMSGWANDLDNLQDWYREE